MLKKKNAVPKAAHHKEEDFELRLDYWHEEVVEVHIEMLKPYPDHPFKPLPPEKLEALAESIRVNGLQQPVILWDLEDTAEEQWEYTIVSGHNRVEAMRMLGKDRIPAIIRIMDDDAAALTVVQTNLEQREGLLPSEKARAYKMQMEIIQKMGSNTADGGHDVHRGKTRDILAQGQDTTGRTIQRYIRLTELFDDYLDLMDQGILSLAAGYELSFLDKDAQCDVWIHFYQNNPKYRISVKTAAAIRAAFEAGQLVSEESIPSILAGMETEKPKTGVYRFSYKELRKRYALPTDFDLSAFMYEVLEERYGRA